MIAALTGELSSLSLITYLANYLIPISRYGGFVLMVAVAISLTRNQQKVQVAEGGNTGPSHPSTQLARST
jgi:hypothetical protein